jgi:ATP-binding cassette subfamily B protein
MSSSLRFRAPVERTDCGPACLAMVLEYFGKWVPLDEVRAVTSAGRDGSDGATIIAAAHWYGLEARGVQADLGDLASLGTGSLLFWKLSHFVVLERVRRRGIVILDPAVGRRTVRWDEVDRCYSGVAILLDPGEGFEYVGERRNGLGRYFRVVLEQRATLGKVLTTSLLIRVLALALPLLMAVLIDRVVPTGSHDLLVVLAACLATMVSFSFLSAWLRSRLLVALRTRVDLATTVGFLRHLVALPYTFHLRRSSGDMMMRLRSNAMVRELLTTAALSAVFDGMFAFFYLLLLFWLAPQVGLIVVSLGAIQVVVFVLARRATQRLATEALAAEARSQGYTFQLIAGIETLKAAGAEGRAVDRFSRLFSSELATSMARGRLTALVESVNGALSLGSPLVVLIVAGHGVLKGSFSLGTALAVNAVAGGFLGPLGALMATSLSFPVIMSYLERLDDVFDTPREQEGKDVRSAPRLTGEITLENVSFQYAPLASRVVEDVSVRVSPGQTVALVGRSGSGKTTLAGLLLGLYEPTEGRVRYDGLDLTGLEAQSVRTQLGVVTQSPYLFSTSIRDNVTFGNVGIPLSVVRGAARQACIADDVEKMPMAYDTILGDGGASLSGGQRQRVALARALAGNPRILLLDEATSHLDMLTEAAVFEQLAGLDCTKIIVAHRLSTIANADLILVLDGGRLVEHGRHDDLLAAGGHYAALVTGHSAVATPQTVG